MPDDVADRDPEPPAAELDGLVEVAARGRPVGGRQVADGERQPVHLRQRLRQQRLLERRREVVLGLVAPRAPERLAAQPRQREQVVAVVRPEDVRVIEDQPDRAERLAVVRQRQQRRRLRLRADLGEARVRAEDRLRALQPQRRDRPRGVRERELGVEREGREALPRVASPWPAACASSSVRLPSSSSATHALLAPSASAPCAAAVAATSCGVSARASAAVVACRRCRRS